MRRQRLTPSTLPRGRSRPTRNPVVCRAESLEGRTLLATISNVSVSEGDDGTRSLMFTVTVPFVVEETGDVYGYSTSDGTATAGSDYAPESGTLRFHPRGSLSRVVGIPVLGDTRIESHETVFLNLFGEFGEGEPAARGTGTIFNDDRVEVRVSGGAAAEGTPPGGGNHVGFQVSLSRPLAADEIPITVPFATSDGSASAGSGNDYVPASGAVTFLPGGPATQQVVVRTVPDPAFEADETFSLVLSAPSLGGVLADPRPDGTAAADGTILNDDLSPMTVSVSDVSGSEAGMDWFLVSLSRPLAPGEPAVTVNYATADGTATAATDYLETRGSLAFSHGGPASLPVFVPVVNDALIEADETLFLDLSDARGATIADGRGQALIASDDGQPPDRGFGVRDVRVAEGTGDVRRVAVFTVRLPFVSEEAGETFAYRTDSAGGSATPGEDYVHQTGTLIFHPRGTGTHHVSVPIIPDAASEPDERFALVLSSFEGEVGRAWATIVNDDIPPRPQLPPGAHFDWTMPDRFGLDTNGNGLIDLPNTAEYASAAVFDVLLDGTGSNVASGSPIVDYAWTVEGPGIDGSLTGSGATPALRLAEGTYQVALDVRAADGTTHSVVGSMPVVDHLIVAMGDSYGSGEGAPERYGAHYDNRAIIEDTWADGLTPEVTAAHRRAHRSTLAGAPQAALELERADPRNSVTFVFLSSSGGTIEAGVLGPYGGVEPDGVEDPPQFQQAIDLVGRRRTIDSLLISVGGNDAGFGDIVKELLILDPGILGLGQPIFGTPLRDALLANQFDIFDGKLARLTNVLYPTMDMALRRNLDLGKVYISEYPDPSIGPDGNTSGAILWDIFPGLEADWSELEQTRARVIEPLNAAIAATAARLGWEVVDGVSAEYFGHGYSADSPAGDPARARYIRTHSESVVLQGPVSTGPVSPGTLHPNELGYQAYKRQMLRVMGRRNPDPANPSFFVEDARVEEGTGPAGAARSLAFTLRLSAPLSRQVTVRYATSDGTATESTTGADYLRRQGAAQFAPGTSSLTIRVPVNPDALVEPDETVLLDLFDAAGALVSDFRAVGTIVNDDAPPTIAARHVFYNDSAFDGRSAAADARDDDAIAAGKRPLLPVGAPSADNVTGYSRGINGVMIDLAGLPPGASLAADDFDFRTGLGTSWTTAPAPSAIEIRRGAGASGSDRITLTWNDGAIRNTWLQVTLRATARTGLDSPDVFSFGNLIGDTGDRAPGAAASVDALDLLRTRRALGTNALIDNPYDHNRDGRVTAADYALARASQSRRLGQIAVPPAPLSTPAVQENEKPTDLLR